jgi:hypothetical protein
MRGLAYLEWRHAVNQFKTILRSPGRSLLWAPYVLMLALFMWTRTLGGTHAHGALAIGHRYADAAAGLYAGSFGLAIAIAARGTVYAFRNPAEAIFFSNAGIPPLQIALWLQLRKLAGGATRWLAGIAYFFFAFVPASAGPLATARGLGAAVLAIVLQMSVALPAFLVARGRLQRPVALCGWALAAAGFAFGTLATAAPATASRLAALAHVDPGSVPSALVAGKPLAVLAAGALLAGLVLAVALLGGDALPELYAASLRTPVARRREAAAKGTNAASSSARRIPQGALALVWKEWVEFCRGQGNVRGYFAAVAFSAAAGAGLAIVAARSHDDSITASLAVTAALALVILAPAGASYRIASDLGKPLFWLSPAPLRARVAAWTFARSWRAALAIGCAPLCAALVLGDGALAFAALPVAFAAYWSLQALGVGLFALLPNRADARGPMALVRTAATLAFAFFPAVAALALLLAGATALLATLGAALVFALQGWGVLEFAAARFAERGASLATLARST